MPYIQKSNPFKKISVKKATKKVCLPKNKVMSMSKAERDKVTRAKKLLLVKVIIKDHLKVLLKELVKKEQR